MHARKWFTFIIKKSSSESKCPKDILFIFENRSTERCSKVKALEEASEAFEVEILVKSPRKLVVLIY